MLVFLSAVLNCRRNRCFPSSPSPPSSPHPPPPHTNHRMKSNTPTFSFHWSHFCWIKQANQTILRILLSEISHFQVQKSLTVLFYLQIPFLFKFIVFATLSGFYVLRGCILITIWQENKFSSYKLTICVQVDNRSLYGKVVVHQCGV